jgi:hypothetical protein
MHIMMRSRLRCGLGLLGTPQQKNAPCVIPHKVIKQYEQCYCTSFNNEGGVENYLTLLFLSYS